MNRILELTNIFNAFAPGFKDDWDQEDGIYNEGSATSVHSLFSYFSHFVAERLDLNDVIEKKKLFNFCEDMMCFDNKNERDAVATCFLQNLLNVAGFKFKVENYIPYLGSESKTFCRAWDKFCGGKTEGLW